MSKDNSQNVLSMMENVTSRLEQAAAQGTIVAKLVEGVDLKDLPKPVKKKVEQFIALGDRITEIKMEVKRLVGALQKEQRKLEKKLKQIDESLAPQIQRLEDQMVRAGDIVVKYDPTESQRPAYQAGYEIAIDHVNETVRKACEDALERTRKTVRWLERSREGSVGHRVGFIGALSKFFTWIGELVGVIKKDVDDVEDAVDKLERAV
jgi:hypothetical protein